MWALAVGVLLTTGDRYVAAAVVLGAFVVPLALATRLADSQRLPGVDWQLMGRLFAFGGLLGFLASALLERPLTSQPPLVFDSWVGVVEETSKLVLLAVMTRRLAVKTTRSGLVLGGVIGFGFAAFESAGYALAASIDGGDSHAVIAMVLTRAAATPFTHGLWTAIAGAGLFASSRNGRFRPTLLAVVALAGVAAVHAGWDLMPNLAADLQTQLAGASSGHAMGADLSANLLDAAGQALLSVPPLYAAYRLRPRPKGGAGSARVPASEAVAAVGRLDRSAA